MDKKDLYIKAKLQQDKEVSSKAKEIFEKFEEEINLEKNNKQKERKVIRLSLNQAILAFVSLVVVVLLGGNLYAHITGRPNIYSAIKGLFVKEAKYTASEVAVDQTVESNGIKLTLKTVAMDENLLITKYIAEGEKLANDFYTYDEFEADIIEYLHGNGTVRLDTMSRMVDRMTAIGLTNGDPQVLFDKAIEAYRKYNSAVEEDDEAKILQANRLIEETIALWEQKTANQKIIITDNAKLQEFSIQSIAQKIERSGNQYIIYNMYNVDTITDLASKFNLEVNISKIGSTNGKWNFSTKLEKARLDTRVETIDFYENNVNDNVAPNILVSDGRRHTATVEVKRLVISDFSSVLMIQTRENEIQLTPDEDIIDDDTYKKYAEDGLPCIFVVTDEKGKVVGTGTCKKEIYEKSGFNNNLLGVYTDRIILENVDINTKKLYVKIYEQYSLDDEIIKYNNGTIELDIEAARNSNHIELNQSLYNKENGVSLKYPGNWTIEEDPSKKDAQTGVQIYSPIDVDGNKVIMEILKQGKGGILTDIDNAVKSTITIDGYTGKVYTKQKQRGNNVYIIKDILIEKDNSEYCITISGEEKQFSRYSSVVDKILQSIKFLEAEKSYKEYSDEYATIKLYEDNKIGVNFTSKMLDTVKNLKPNLGVNISTDKEYIITTGNIALKPTSVITGISRASWTNPKMPLIFLEFDDLNNSNKYKLCYINIFKSFKNGEIALEEIDGLPENVKYSIWFDVAGAVGGRNENGDYMAELTAEPVNGLHQHRRRINYDANGSIFAEKEFEPGDDNLEDSNQQTPIQQMSYKTFNISNGVLKQYEDSNNTIIVEFNDSIKEFKEYKNGYVKPNEVYTIKGINGIIKSVYSIKDTKGEQVPAISILTEGGELYSSHIMSYGSISPFFDAKNKSWDFSSMSVWNPLQNVEQIYQSQDDYLIAKTSNSLTYKVDYHGYSLINNVTTPTNIPALNISYNSFTLSNGTLKQYQDNTITIEFNDTITQYEQYKKGYIQPNIEYKVKGINDEIKQINWIFNNSEEPSLPVMYVLTETGILYRIEIGRGLANTGEIRDGTGEVRKVMTDIDKITQSRSDYIFITTKENKMYKVDGNSLLLIQGNEP